MPALLPVPNVVRCVQHVTCNGANAVNVFHVRAIGITGPYDATTVHAVAVGVRTNYKNDFLPQISHDAFMGACEAVDLTNAFGQQGTAPGSDQAGIFSPSQSAAVAACISWQAARHYRGGHGRTYLPFIPQSSISDPRTLGNATITALTTGAGNFLNNTQAITAGGATAWELVLVHRYRGKAVLNPPEAESISSVKVDHRVDSQRRRLGRPF